MATRESSVKLTLSNSQFLTGMKRAGAAVQRLGLTSKNVAKHMGAGFKRVGSDLRGMAGAAKTGLKALASLGGAFTVGASIKNAVELRSTYETLAFRVQTATGAMTKGVDIQELAERAAAKTTRTSAEMAAAFEEVFGATKDLAFTRDMLESIGTTATGAGEEVATVATISQQLQRKFGFNAGQAKEALAQIFEQAQQGGPKMSQFAETLDVMGSNLLQAGFEGQEALNFLLGSLNATDAAMGGLGKQVKGMQQLLINLGNAPELEKLAKDLGMNAASLINEKDFMTRMRKILSQGDKGLKALKANFIGTEEQKALKILFTDPFEKALQRARAGGLKGKEATEQALRALDGSIANFGKSALTAADMQARAAERATEPQARLRVAMERLNQAFARPEIIDAIDQLSAHLPAVAGVFADFVRFAAQNPVLAGALGLSASVARSFLTGMITSIVSGHATGGAGAAASITQAHVVGGMKVGSIIRGAGALAAIAIAGAVAAEKIDKDATANAQTTGGISVARAKLANRGGSLKRQREEARFAEKAIAAKESDLDSLGSSLFMSDDQRRREERELREAKEDLKWKKAHIAKLERAEQSKPPPAADPAAGAPIAPAQAGRGKVNLDDQSARSIGKAVQAAVTGGVLRVQVVGGGMGGGAGPGGSRGPMVIGKPATLGGV